MHLESQRSMTWPLLPAPWTGPPLRRMAAAKSLTTSLRWGRRVRPNGRWSTCPTKWPVWPTTSGALRRRLSTSSEWPLRTKQAQDNPHQLPQPNMVRTVFVDISCIVLFRLYPILSTGKERAGYHVSIVLLLLAHSLSETSKVFGSILSISIRGKLQVVFPWVLHFLLPLSAS